MHQGAERLERLILQLLALARADENLVSPTNFVALDLAEAVEQAVADRVVGMPRHVQLGCDIEARPLPVLSDPVLLAEVFGNLIDNAIKYSGEKGRSPCARRGRGTLRS